MKAISIKQPWAGLILFDGKDVENRTWSSSYRGPLLIHTSRQIDRAALQNWSIATRIKWAHAALALVTTQSPFFITGAILGVCRLIDVTPVCSSEWHEHGKIGFYVEDATAFESPIRYKGKPSLFNVPDEVVRRELEQCGFQINGDE